jgi:hypothetical protein
MTHCLVNHHITGHLVFVLVSTEWVMMCPAIDNLASCEICAVIRFLHAKNTSAAEIHCELWQAVYGQTVMSEGTVRKWCRMCKDGRINAHDEERSGCPSEMSDDLVQSTDQTIRNFRTFVWIATISNLWGHSGYRVWTLINISLGWNISLNPVRFKNMLGTLKWKVFI